jgi:hypothetical protein
MPRQVRGGHSRQEAAPTKKLANLSIAPRQVLDDIERLLGGPPRCGACHRPLYILRSVLAGIGPTCLRKRSGGGS